jgi:hypothetical protein
VPFYRGAQQSGSWGGGLAGSGATRREDERGGSWWRVERRGGPTAVAPEQRSRDTAGRCSSVEQGDGGRRHVGPRPQYRAAW